MRRGWTFAILVLSVSLVVPAAGAKTVGVGASEYAFEPRQLDVGPGEDVVIEVTNRGAMDHTFVIDALDIDLFVPAGMARSVTIRTPPEGTYAFYCRLSDHRTLGMEGTLRVVSPAHGLLNPAWAIVAAVLAAGLIMASLWWRSGTSIDDFLRARARLVSGLVVAVVIASVVGVAALTPAAQAPTTAMDFGMYDLNGEPFLLSSFRGKAVLIDFMATWCVTCQVEVPTLNRIAAAFPAERFVILSVTIDQTENATDLAAFRATYNATWSFATPWNAPQVIAFYEVTGLPKHVLVDAAGAVRWSSVGFTDEATIRAQVEAVV